MTAMQLLPLCNRVLQELLECEWPRELVGRSENDIG
jgi:hypothetical protein